MYDFSGKIVLVTGAARKRSLGHATAVRFAKEGANLVLVSQNRPVESFPETERMEGWLGLESVADEVRALGRRAQTVVADVTKRSDVEAMVEKALKEFGRIDILVNNAGISARGAAIVDLPEELWNQLIAVNLTGTFLCSQAVARHMIARGGGGAIVNVSSRLGKEATPNSVGYVASKFGVIGLTQCLALELVSHNIRVNAICPGRIATTMGAKDKFGELIRGEGLSYEEAVRRANADALPYIPMDRISEPEEQAAVIAFLASEEASYMTGQSINVTGGRTMH